MRPWIGVDLDGTLAKYDGFKGPGVIGEPIPDMVKRIRGWIAAGKAVYIFTARVNPKSPGAETARAAIAKWTKKVFGYEIPARSDKDSGMVEAWDDRSVQVKPNTGKRVDGKE